MNDQQIIAAAADAGNRALDAKRIGVITATAAAEITGDALAAVNALRGGDRAGAVALLDDARGLLDAIA